LSGRLRFRLCEACKEQRRAKATHSPNQISDVLTEKQHLRLEKNPKSGAQAAKTEAGKTSEVEAAASFIRMQSDGQFAALPPIPLAEKEVILGTDPVQCTQIMDDPSISSVHARLRA
jgi:hypothetical protein